MKILRLDLIAFGPFTGQSLDFRGSGDGGGTGVGLHLIYGPNEAGKSSTLRALRQFFFGIESRTADDFLHSYTSLRIGAVLERGDGSTLHAIRRKGNKQTLRGPNDVDPLDDQELSRLLGGISEAEFTHRFGIDHEGLIAGSQEMLAGGGEVGQSLFAAAGISHLQAIVERLEKESADLFTPRGQNPRINQAKSRWKNAENRKKEAQLLPADWQQHRDALAAAEKTQKEAKARKLACEARRHRLERVQQALPRIALRRDLVVQFQPLAGVPRLRDEFAQQRREAELRLAQATATATDAREQIAEIEQAIGGLSLSEPLLQHAAEIGQLAEQRGAVRKASSDRRRLEGEWNASQREIQRLLAELGRSADEAAGGDAVEKHLRLTTAQKARIRELGDQWSVKLTKIEAARQRRDELLRQRADAQRQLDQCPPPRDSRPLQAAIDAAKSEGDLEKQLDKAREQTRRTLAQAERAAQSLTGWMSTLDRLLADACDAAHVADHSQIRGGGKLPAEETIDRFEREFAELDSALNDLRRQRRDLEQQRLDKSTELNDGGSLRDVPTDDDLLAARRIRDQGWELAAATLRGESPAAELVLEFVERFPHCENLAAAMRAAIGLCDELADRMRRDSERVARKASLRGDVTRLDQSLANLAIEFAAVEQRRADVAERWRLAWAGLVVEPLSPREMSGWRTRFASLQELADAIVQLRADEARLADRVATHRQRLIDQLSAFAADGGSPAEASSAASAAALSLPEWLSRGEAAVKQCLADRDDRRTAELHMQQAEQEQPKAEAEVRAAEADLAAWQEHWAKAVAAIRLSADASPTEARETVDAIANLRQAIESAERVRERIDGMDADRREFTEWVQRLVRVAADDLPEPPGAAAAESAVDELQRRLSDSQKAQARRTDLQSRLTREQEKLVVVVEQSQSAARNLAALCAEAGAAAPAELPALEEQAARRRDLERQLQQIDEQLRLLAAGQSLDDFIADAARESADELPGEIQSLAEEIESLEAEQQSLAETVGRERETLDRMDGSAAAAEAEEEAQALLAQMRDDAERFVRLRLASAVLQRAIQRYREKNQGPVLRRAGELFADLTGGSFTGLRDDFDEQGKPVLLAVRDDRTTALGVKALSDGTRDQLFLALRLASLEQFLDQHDPIPLIVDDLLVHFDNARATATLQVLAKLSARTQILFFTHHQHLLDLAEKHLPPQQFFVHRLS